VPNCDRADRVVISHELGMIKFRLPTHNITKPSHRRDNLDYDDVPWNNNNAEHAVKAFATLRRVIDGITSENGLHDFLVLLSLCETSKYKNVDFLRSGSENIDDFVNQRRRRA
jgi:hypothetical protein